ncbi:MAG: amino acid ABC transporter permease [Clostridia bacterium]|nr:amino acid ABC transporter permease [Clostridia bacterium]
MLDFPVAWQLFWNKFIEGQGYKNFLIGLENTAIIAVFGLIIGFLIGCMLAIVNILRSRSIPVLILKGIVNVYITLFRGTPMVVQLLLLHYAVFSLLSINIDSVAEAVIIFGMNSGAYMAEIIRSGINAVDEGQMEAGRCVGMSFGATMVRIVLPQAIKNILPTIGNEFISLIKETSVVSFIAVMDITKSFQTIANSTYEYFIPYIMLALVYLVIVLLFTVLLKNLEKRMKKNER